MDLLVSKTISVKTPLETDIRKQLSVGLLSHFPKISEKWLCMKVISLNNQGNMLKFSKLAKKTYMHRTKRYVHGWLLTKNQLIYHYIIYSL